VKEVGKEIVRPTILHHAWRERSGRDFHARGEDEGMRFDDHCNSWGLNASKISNRLGLELRSQLSFHFRVIVLLDAWRRKA
jgi:hypothetical protein